MVENNNNNNIFDTYTSYVANKVNSLELWKKQLYMIFIALYIAASCCVTIFYTVNNFRTELPLKIVDILIIFAMSVLLIINLLFIYGCYTSNRVLLYLTPAIPNFIVIFVMFPQIHAFYYPLISFLNYNGLEKTTLNYILNNLGNFTILRIFIYIPILLYSRFLFNSYTDDFIDALQEEIDEQREEAERAKKEAEEAAAKAEAENAEKKDIEGEGNGEEKPNEVSEENNNEPVDPEAKKNN